MDRQVFCIPPNSPQFPCGRATGTWDLGTRLPGLANSLMPCLNPPSQCQLPSHRPRDEFPVRGSKQGGGRKKSPAAPTSGPDATGKAATTRPSSLHGETCPFPPGLSPGPQERQALERETHLNRLVPSRGAHLKGCCGSLINECLESALGCWDERVRMGRTVSLLPKRAGSRARCWLQIGPDKRRTTKEEKLIRMFRRAANRPPEIAPLSCDEDLEPR